MIQYPDYLPCFRVDYSYAQNNTIKSTEFQSGFKRNRRRFKDVPVNFNLSLLLTDAQLAIFEAWRYYEVEDVNWFNATLKTGAGLEEWTVRFNDNGESKTYSENHWTLSFSVEARKQRYLDQMSFYEKLYDVTQDTGLALLQIIQKWKG